MDNLLKISDIVKNGYEKINEFYKNYLISKGNTDDEQYWSRKFQEELIRHNTAEEIILYPAYKKYFDKQDNDIVEQSLHDHENMKKLLFFLETTSITDPQYYFSYNRLIHIFQKHMKCEEQSNLPKLENNIPNELSQQLAKSFQQTKDSHHLKVYPRSSINPPL